MGSKVSKVENKDVERSVVVESKDCEQIFTFEICTEPSTQRFRHNHNFAPNSLKEEQNNSAPNSLKKCSPNICLTCLASHIQAKVDENIATISCPMAPNCNETLNPFECQPPLIPAEIFAKWCDCLCKSLVSTSKSCYCPNRDYSELILNECNETKNKCECPRCKRLLCFKCRVPWHPGFRCSESSQRWDSNDRAFADLVDQKKWTRCPRCGQPVERVRGCPKVRCRCGSVFCHNCGGTMTSLHLCDPCLASHIQARVDENAATISCPMAPDCKETLNPFECQPPLIPAEIFAKWCDCLCRSLVSTSKSCYCPNRECSELILNECNETKKKCECPRCKRLLCFKCRVPWHPGFRCSESSRRWDSSDRAFRVMVDRMKWTRCPGCGQPIERISGCPTVQCRCGSLFCHNCGGTLTSSPHLCNSERVRRIGKYALLILVFCFVISHASFLIWHII